MQIQIDAEVPMEIGAVCMRAVFEDMNPWKAQSNMISPFQLWRAPLWDFIY